MFSSLCKHFCKLCKHFQSIQILIEGNKYAECQVRFGISKIVNIRKRWLEIWVWPGVKGWSTVVGILTKLTAIVGVHTKEPLAANYQIKGHKYGACCSFCELCQILDIFQWAAHVCVCLCVSKQQPAAFISIGRGTYKLTHKNIYMCLWECWWALSWLTFGVFHARVLCHLLLSH